MDISSATHEVSDDVNIPPAQDSPHNVLNALNDFCIQSIFQYLTELPDFINASDVCTRFRDNAIECFQLMFGNNHTFYTSDIHSTRVHDDNRLSFQHKLSLLQNFGDLIEVINLRICDGEENVEKSNKLFQTIVKHCGKTLRFLAIIRHYDCSAVSSPNVFVSFNFDSPDQFSTLSCLRLDGITFGNFCLSPTLCILEINSIKNKNLKDIIRSYPELTSFRLKCDDPKNNKLYKSLCLKVLELNPQINMLKTSGFMISLNDIYDRIPNIWMLDCSSFKGNLKASKTFQRMTYLAVMKKITNKQMIQIVTHMPNLTTFSIFSRKSPNVKIIIDTLEIAKNLKKMTVWYMVLDSEGYQYILDTIKGRAVPFVLSIQSINGVSKEVLDANSHWLEIKLK